MFVPYLLEELQAVLAEEPKVDLLHVDKEAKEVADTFANCTDVLFLGIEPLDSVLRGVEGSQGASSLFF